MKNTIISCKVWCEILIRAKVPAVLLTTFAQSKCQHGENGKYPVSINMKIVLTSETLGVSHTWRTTIISDSYYFYRRHQLWSQTDAGLNP